MNEISRKLKSTKRTPAVRAMKQKPVSEEAPSHLTEKAETNHSPMVASLQWPQLDERALYGLAGDIVRTTDPHTEADRVGILVQLLVAFGSKLGRKPHCHIEATNHYTNLNCVLVGLTSKGRKGTAWSHVRRIFKGWSDDDWAEQRIAQGLSSGEGLICAVRDPVERVADSSEKKSEVEEGVNDKRLLVVQTEFASVLRVMDREGNTLSPTIRDAWDTGDLRTLVKKNPMRATGAHISIVGHITKDELLRHLDRTEAASGFANRFLWTLVRRSKKLPWGGNVPQNQLGPLIEKLKCSVEAARKVDVMTFSQEARAEWERIYPDLSEGRPGLCGAVTARAEPHVLRLACIYALLDLHSEVQVQHLNAAKALWDYCDESARFIFGEALGDPMADEILRALHRQGAKGMTRTDVNDLFKGHKKSTAIEAALRVLVEQRLISSKVEQTSGRSAERYTAL